MDPQTETRQRLDETLEIIRHLPGLRPGAAVLAAMSGGVDSSVMAALLQKAGFQVVGVSMHLFGKESSGEAAGRCCTLDDFQDARRVAFECGFPHYVMDFQKDFRSAVIDPFMESYLRGETPSPCIWCNQHLKFSALLRKADDLGIRHVATGHYARITQDEAGWHLGKALDPDKDQSYFLFHHTQETLARTLFPLAHLSKQEVRVLGTALGLHLAEKSESQEICFVGADRYDAYIEKEGRAPQLAPGPLRHVDGRLLGQHDGFWRYTIGQRKGLRIAYPEPLYVVRLEPQTNTVWVGEKPQLKGARLQAREMNWCCAPRELEFHCRAKIRSRSPEIPAQVKVLADSRIEVFFPEPPDAIAPGQAIVLYREGEVLGGGWIERADSTEFPAPVLPIPGA